MAGWLVVQPSRAHLNIVALSWELPPDLTAGGTPGITGIVLRKVPCLVSGAHTTCKTWSDLGRFQLVKPHNWFIIFVRGNHFPSLAGRRGRWTQIYVAHYGQQEMQTEKINFMNNTPGLAWPQADPTTPLREPWLGGGEFYERVRKSHSGFSELKCGCSPDRAVR